MNLYNFIMITIYIVIIGVVFLLVHKKGKKSVYDERQQVARGYAYRAGFYGTFVYLLVNAVLNGYRIYWCDAATLSIYGILFGGMIFAVVAIFKEAYLGLYEQTRRSLLRYGLLGLINLYLGLQNFSKIIKNGKMTVYSCSLAVAAIFLIIIMSIFIKQYQDRKEETA